MTSQYCGGEEEEWKVESMCGFHRFEQGLPKRLLPHASERLISGCNCRLSSDELLGYLSRVSSNTINFG